MDQDQELHSIIRAHVIQFLIIGNVLKKYPYSRGKPQMRHLKVDDATTKDARVRFGHPKKRKGYKDVPLVRVHSITSGKRTSALKRQKAAKSAYCFSIVETSRTLDLECESKEDRDMWVAALRFLLMEENIRQHTTIKNVSVSSMIAPDPVQINCIVGHIAQRYPLVPSDEATLLPLSAAPTTIPEETPLEDPAKVKPSSSSTPAAEKSAAAVEDAAKAPAAAAAAVAAEKDTETPSSVAKSVTDVPADDASSTSPRPTKTAPAASSSSSDEASRSSKKKKTKKSAAAAAAASDEPETPAYFEDDGDEAPEKSSKKRGPRPPKEPRPASVKPLTSPKIDVDLGGGDAPAWLHGGKGPKSRRGSDGSVQRATTPKAKSSRPAKEKETSLRQRSEVISRGKPKSKRDKSLKSAKSEKTLKRDKSEKSLKRDKSEKTIKRDKSEKTLKRDKSEKSLKRDKSEKTLKREKSLGKKPRPPKGPKPEHLKAVKPTVEVEAEEEPEQPSKSEEDEEVEATADADTSAKEEEVVGEELPAEATEEVTDAGEDAAGPIVSEAEAESDEPKIESDEPKIESDGPKIESDEPKVESDEPKVESDEPKVESGEPKVESDEPKVDDEKAAEVEDEVEVDANAEVDVEATPEKKAAKEKPEEGADDKAKVEKKSAKEKSAVEKSEVKSLQNKLRANLEAALSQTPPGSNYSSRRPSVNSSRKSSLNNSRRSSISDKVEATPKASTPREVDTEAPVVAKPKEKTPAPAKRRGFFGWGGKKSEKKEKGRLAAEKEAKQLKEQAKLDKERAKLEEKQKKEQAKADAKAAKEKARSLKKPTRKKSDEKKAAEAAAKLEAAEKEKAAAAKEEKKSAAAKMLAAQSAAAGSGGIAGPKRPPGPRRPPGTKPSPVSTKEHESSPKKSSGDYDPSNGVDTSSAHASKVSDYVSKINKLDPSKIGGFMLPMVPRGGTLSRKGGPSGKNGSRPSSTRNSLRVPSRLNSNRSDGEDTEDDDDSDGSDGEEPSRANGVEIFDDDDEEEEEEEKDVRSSANFNKNLMFGQSVLAALLAKGPPPKANPDAPARLEGAGVDDGATGKSEIEHVVMARPTVGGRRKSRKPARRKKIALEVDDDLGLDF